MSTTTERKIGGMFSRFYSFIIGPLLRAANHQSMWEDDPPTLGTGNRAQMFPITGLGLTKKLKVSSFQVRFELPPAANEDTLVRLYRYRKTASGGDFTYTLLGSLAVTSATPWSWDNDITLNDKAMDINPDTDGLTCDHDYTKGDGEMRALNISFECGRRTPADDDIVAALGAEVPTTATYPPT